MRQLALVGTFIVSPDQRNRFMLGDLWREWLAKYPVLFDHDDARLAESQAQLGYHFYEWLAAIMLYHGTGWLSLVEKYQFKNHDRKRQVVTQLNCQALDRALAYCSEHDRPQCPDLLVYPQDFSDWYFCEVKGPGDSLSAEQRDHFRTLAEITGRPVRLVRFRFEK